MLAAPAVAPGDGWGISANPNVAKPNLVKPHFGENSHRIEINLVRIFTELALQFYRVFSSFFFSIWRVWRIRREFSPNWEPQPVRLTEISPFWRTLLGTGNWGEVGRGRDTMNAKNYIQVDVGGGVGLGGDSTNSKKSLFSEYDL